MFITFARKSWMGKGLPAIAAAASSVIVCYQGRASIYAVTNLSAVSGQQLTNAFTINDAGTVVGSYANGGGANSTYQYSGGTIATLDSVLPDYTTAANAQLQSIDAAGDIALTYFNSSYRTSAAVISATGAVTPIPLAPGGGNRVTATGINSSGVVVGDQTQPYQFSNGTVFQTAQAYVFKNGVATNIGVLFSGATSNGVNHAFGINSSGQVAGSGQVDTASPRPYDAYIATPHNDGSYTFQDLSSGLTNAFGYADDSSAYAINDAGHITGEYYYSGASGQQYGYYYDGAHYYSIPGFGGTSLSTYVYSINSQNQIVGSGTLMGGSHTYDALLYQNGNTQDLNTLLNSSSAGWNLSSAYSINSSGQIVGTATYNGTTSAFLLTPTAATLTWNNSHTIGVNDPNPTTDNNNDKNPTDGVTWDVNTTQNWNGGSTTLDTIFSNGDYVTFNDSNNGHYTVNINSIVMPGSLTINTANSYTFNGSGGIAGTTSLLKTGTGVLNLSTTNTYTGGTNVSAGSLVLGSAAALPVGGSLMIGNSGSVIALNHSAGVHAALQPSSLTLAGSIGAWVSKLDLQNNDLIVQSGDMKTITNQVAQGYANGTWNGSGGITSSTAAANTSHLTALGVIANQQSSGVLYGSNSSLGTFDGTNPGPASILVRYTYYGDANLDGKVDGSDYSRIDGGFLTHATGWFNGDFNYDGVINGSDYTLIDNAFNTQGAAFPSASIAPQVYPTAEIAEISTVPESGPMLIASSVALLTLVRRRPSTATKK